MGRERKGSVVERDGKLYVRVSYTDSLGKRRELMRRAKDKKHARELKKQLVKQLENSAEQGNQRAELDALEAVHPGALARIVTDAILQYYDRELRDKAEEAYADFEKYLEKVSEGEHLIFKERRDELDEEYEELWDEWQAVRAKFDELVEPYDSRRCKTSVNRGMLRKWPGCGRSLSLLCAFLHVFRRGFWRIVQKFPTGFRSISRLDEFPHANIRALCGEPHESSSVEYQPNDIPPVNIRGRPDDVGVFP